MKPSVVFHKDRITLTLPKLADFDAAYPDVEEEAIARSIPVVDIYRGAEFITQINVKRYQQTFAAYTYTRLSRSSANSMN